MRRTQTFLRIKAAQASLALSYFCLLSAIEAMVNLQALLLVACCFAPLVAGAIYNLERQTDDELVQPLEVNISPDEDLGDLVEQILEPEFFA